MVSVLPKEGFITAKELASFLGISEPSVKAYVKRNSMHFVVIGKKWLIDLSQFGAGKGGSGESPAPRKPRKKAEEPGPETPEGSP
jgi:excisionase family DNA binding protein